MSILVKGHTFSDGDQITSTKLNNLVDNATFASGAVDDVTIGLSGGQLFVKNIGTGNIPNGSITTAKIADSAVTASKLASSSVEAAKIASDAVTTAKILNLNVTAEKLADGAATTVKIADANVTAAKLSGAQTGNAPVFGIRAWAKFAGQGSNGACVVNASGNVTSVSRISSGLYEVVMTTAMPDANYCIMVNSLAPTSRIETFTETTTAFRVEFRGLDGSNNNPTEAHVMVIR